MVEVSVVIPTKNEEASIGTCIEKVQRVFTTHHIDGEIVVADNSTDNTPEIAKRPGVRVVVPDEHGYGNAYRFGFARASGDCVVMGDGDDTYDFMDIPGLLEPLKRGIGHRLTLSAICEASSGEGINTDLKNEHLNKGAEA